MAGVATTRDRETRVNRFFLTLVLGLAGCAPDWAMVDEAFCEDDEGCADPTSQDFTCNGVRCADVLHNGSCIALFECTDEGKCLSVEAKPGYSESPCVVNTCDNGKWTVSPKPSIDDGDECTEDTCSENGHVDHHYICG